jgi:hypothetical protein
MTRKTAQAEENDMNTVELQRILGYLNVGLAIAHDSGVSIGHFGSGDFIQLAQTVNGMLLHSIAPTISQSPENAGADVSCGISAVIRETPNVTPVVAG